MFQNYTKLFKKTFAVSNYLSCFYGGRPVSIECILTKVNLTYLFIIKLLFFQNTGTFVKKIVNFFLLKNVIWAFFQSRKNYKPENVVLEKNPFHNRIYTPAHFHRGRRVCKKSVFIWTLSALEGGGPMSNPCPKAFWRLLYFCKFPQKMIQNVQKMVGEGGQGQFGQCPKLSRFLLAALPLDVKWLLEVRSGSGTKTAAVSLGE